MPLGSPTLSLMGFRQEEAMEGAERAEGEWIRVISSLLLPHLWQNGILTLKLLQDESSLLILLREDMRSGLRMELLPSYSLGAWFPE